MNLTFKSSTGTHKYLQNLYQYTTIPNPCKGAYFVGVYSNVKFNAKAVKDAYSKAKTKRKHPTSVNLPEEVITGLKALALEMGVPYQTLMRQFITEGLAKRKKGA